MMKKKVLIVLSVLILIAVAVSGAYAIDMNRMKNNKPVVFSSWGYDYALPEVEQNDYPLDNEEQSFVGKVLEETTTYMIVEPVNDEYEKTVAGRISTITTRT